MNRENITTLIITIITYAVVCVNVLTGKEISLDPETVGAVAALIAAGIMYWINHYYNHDYTGISKKMTPIMRKLKRLEEAGDLRLMDQIEHLIEEWEGENNDN